ncbi:MAG: NAD(P)H-hydrate dehydratase [Candidatus Eisenbacteria bacterium]
MKLVTRETMRAIDRHCIDVLGIPGLKLMENAGSGTVQFLEREAGPLSEKRVAVVCGKGNNGGDGFVIARELRARGADVRVFLVGTCDDVEGDARVNLDRLGRGEVAELTDAHDAERLAEDLGVCDVVVDALFGTGFQGEPRGPSAVVIGQMRLSRRPVLAVDVPSGLDATTGVAAGECVRAHWTCTMGFPKRGLFVHPGRTFVGRIHVVDIGVPPEAVEAVGVRDNVLTTLDAAAMLPARPADGHKGTFGRVLVVAGSVGYSGAAALASSAALRSGAGLVCLACPSSLNDVLEAKLTEVITAPLPETAERSISMDALPRVLELLATADALAIGPGVSRHPDTARLVREIVGSVDVPCVVDADGLNALSIDDVAGRSGGAPFVLTPHPGEMARLLRCGVADVQEHRQEVVRDAASRAGATVLLKGAATVSADPSGELYLNPTGNSGLASAGTGDVLTGMVAALLARRLGALPSAALAAFAHGLAGDLTAERFGTTGMVAGDVLAHVPESFRAIERAA